MHTITSEEALIGMQVNDDLFNFRYRAECATNRIDFFTLRPGHHKMKIIRSNKNERRGRRRENVIDVAMRKIAKSLGASMRRIAMINIKSTRFHLLERLMQSCKRKIAAL